MRVATTTPVTMLLAQLTLAAGLVLGAVSQAQAQSVTVEASLAQPCHTLRAGVRETTAHVSCLHRVEGDERYGFNRQMSLPAPLAPAHAQASQDRPFGTADGVAITAPAPRSPFEPIQPRSRQT